MKLYKERYLISICGDVYDTKRNKYMKKSTQSLGYIQVFILGKLVYLHRVVAELYIHRIIDKQEIDHIDGVKSNNSIFNLRWVTKSENIKNSFINGQNYTPIERIEKMNKCKRDKRAATEKLSKTKK